MTAVASVRQLATASVSYPRPVREVHQIELTTRCNLRCHYCPHFPELPREKVDMDDATFEAALDLVAFFVRQGGQTELSLTGIGEPTLHPKFVAMVAAAREVIGPSRRLAVSTNGLLLDDALCAELKPYNPVLFVSLHRPEKAGPALEAVRRSGLLHGINSAFAVSAFNWAGTQKNWFVSAPRVRCDYLALGWAVVLVDGRVATCCLDATGASVVGTVYDEPSSLKTKPWGDAHLGCAACHMNIPQ